MNPVRILSSRTERLIAICGKCSRKLGGGFGPAGSKSLAKVLKRSVAGTTGKRRTVRIVEVKCLDACPKRAVALLDGAQPQTMLIVPAGTPVDDVVEALRLPGA